MATTALLQRGTPEYRRLGAAMWCAGLATFVLVYCVQGLLPALATEFGVSSSTSSLVLSATTGALALAVLPLSSVLESWGRRRVMTAALVTSAVLGLLAPFAPTLGVLVGIRACQGWRWPRCPRWRWRTSRARSRRAGSAAPSGC